jgi:DNA polymerase-1
MYRRTEGCLKGPSGSCYNAALSESGRLSRIAGNIIHVSEGCFQEESSMSRKRLVLIDGMSHIYRAYYAIPKLSNSKGFPTNAVYGFTSMLRKLIDDEAPDYIGVAFDLEGPTVRHEKYEAYKATRKPMPEELVVQLPYIRRVCEVFRVPVISRQGYEADDVIGTLARKAADTGLTSIVVSSDKDMLQLVDEHTVILDPMKGQRILDAQKVVEKLGVMPERVPDLLGLWGDSSDNIPGAPGIGEKGARELLQTYGTIDNCLANWEMVKRKTYQESLRDHADIIRMSRELATIHRDLPLELDLDELVLNPPDRKAAFQLFTELEFKSLMSEFLDEQPKETQRIQWLTPEEAQRFPDDPELHPRIYVALRLKDRSPGGGDADVVCVRMGTNGPILLDLKNETVASAWQSVLSNPTLCLVCWDVKFSRLAQEHSGVPLKAAIEDVMLMAFLTAPNAGDYSLKRWALEQLHLSLPEQDVTGQQLLAEAAQARVADALCCEVEAVRRLWELLSPQLDTLGVRRLYEEVELPLVPVLSAMECAGVKVDPRLLQSLSTEMEEQIAGLRQKIYKSAGIEFNINSTKQLGEVLFEKLNLPMTKKTRKTKGYSTDQAVLEELAQSYELPQLILDYRQFAKLKSTYVDSLPALIHPSTGRVHTSFNQTGAATGRLSSSDPNLQNIPIRTELGRRIRGAFIPEQGNLFVSADYSQVELRVLAHLSEDNVLMEAFRKDEDIHERTAREVFGEAASEDPSDYRRRAKVINFGIVYGLSAFGLGQRLGIPREQAQAFIDAYFERYQGVRIWLDRTIDEARRLGMVRTLLGRIRPIPDIHSKDFAVRQFAERTAVNTPIQGTAADIIKIAMVRIWQMLNKKGLSSKILLQVHDELVLESPEREVAEVQKIIRHEMENAVVLRVPLRVDMGLGRNWMDMK